MDGVSLVFHQAAIRIPLCAEQPRLAKDVLVDGTFNVLEAAVSGPQSDRGVVRVGVRLLPSFPTTEAHHPRPHDLAP
jgi:UDP-glucose 4-epimerase